MNTPPHTARPITVFAARMVRVGERAPRVTRRKDYGEDQTSHSRPPEQEDCMGVTTHSEDPSVDSFAGLNLSLHQDSDSSGNLRDKRQATLNEVGFASAKKVRPSLKQEAFRATSAPATTAVSSTESTPETVKQCKGL
jgi:hypothetical protein